MGEGHGAVGGARFPLSAAQQGLWLADRLDPTEKHDTPARFRAALEPVSGPA